jgi:branched-chain amino acid transport system permease protein
VIGTWTEHHLIVIGLLFMGAVIFLPNGLMGLVRPSIARLLTRETKPLTRDTKP